MNDVKHVTHSHCNFARVHSTCALRQRRKQEAPTTSGRFEEIVWLLEAQERGPIDQPT
ncbi:MAG: hypothetical protein ABJA98_25115 [Acidobacteriota bacterium]